MKKMITLITLILTTRLLMAPYEQVLYLPIEPSVNIYETLITAIVSVESGGNHNAYNAYENACGAFQIRQCRVDHYNRLMGTNYVLNDFFDYELSRQVFLFFTNNRDYETVARAWAGGDAGTKQATDKYWKLIQKQL